MFSKISAPAYLGLAFSASIRFLSSAALMEMAAAKNDGFQEGIEKGKAEGLREGKEIGKKDEKQEIAKNMLNEKCDIELIIKVTGLTKEEIEKLK